MSADQVRWKINALMKKYKECADNNSKSGRAFMTFEFYDIIDQICHKEKSCISTYTMSSNLPVNKKNCSTLTSSTEPEKETILTINQVSKRKSKQVQEKAASNTSSSSDLSFDTNISNFNSSKSSRLPRGTGSSNARKKLELEKQWLEYLKTNENRSKATDENYEKYLKIKAEENQIRKRYLNLREKEMEQKYAILQKKLKWKENAHDEKMELEKLKCKYLKNFANSKKEITDTDSD